MLNHDRDYIKNTYPEFIGCVHLAIGDGWIAHVNIMSDEVIKRVTIYNAEHSTDISISLLQVKEKFGGLRYYYSISNDKQDDTKLLNEIQQYVSRMELVCNHVCEVCGKYGERAKRGTWYKTVCDSHLEGK